MAKINLQHASTFVIFSEFESNHSGLLLILTCSRKSSKESATSSSNSPAHSSFIFTFNLQFSSLAHSLHVIFVSWLLFYLKLIHQLSSLHWKQSPFQCGPLRSDESHKHSAQNLFSYFVPREFSFNIKFSSTTHLHRSARLSFKRQTF